MKSISLLISLLMISALITCMDKPAEHVNSSVFLTKDIFDQKIKPLMVLQEMSRFARTCKAYDAMINWRNIFPQDPRCAYLKTIPYDTLTRFLGYCEITKNKKMFDFVRSWHAGIRDQDEKVLSVCSKKRKGFKFVNSYKKCVSAKYVQKKRLGQLVELCRPDEKRAVLLKTVLRGSSFNVFDSIEKYWRVEKWGRNSFDNQLSRLLFFICCYDDPDLWLAVLGGVIEPRAFGYVFYYAGDQVLDELRKRKVFIKAIDEQGHSAGYYFRCRELLGAQVRETQLRGEKYLYWHPPLRTKAL